MRSQQAASATACSLSFSSITTAAPLWASNDSVHITGTYCVPDITSHHCSPEPPVHHFFNKELEALATQLGNDKSVDSNLQLASATVHNPSTTSNAYMMIILETGSLPKPTLGSWYREGPAMS